MTYSPVRRGPCLLLDYTETLGLMRFRRQSELVLKAGRIEAELANRSKSEFLANMSHELRTPLNAIIGFSDLIQHLNARDPVKSVEYAGNIAEAGRHLLAIISDILDISKIESGTSVPELELCNIGELIEASVLLVRERVDLRKQTLSLEIDTDLPTLKLDARRIRQIVINLLSNANKFTPDRGQITVAARRTPEGGVAVSVSDTGPGMTTEELEIALKPFGQVRNGHLQSHGGVGLGLPIAIALARQHGGDLGFESTPGRGTTITLYLPPFADEQNKRPLPHDVLAAVGSASSLLRTPR